MGDTRILGHLVDDINETIERLQQRIRHQADEIESLRGAMSDQGEQTELLNEELTRVAQKLQDINQSFN